MLNTVQFRKQAVINNVQRAFNVTEPNVATNKVYTDLILQDFNGDLLLLKRSSTDSFQPKKWGLPGGKLEANEQPIQGALRETAEEAGLDLRKPEMDNLIAVTPQQIKIYKPQKGVTIYYTYARLNCVGKNLLLILDQNEHEQYAWIDPEIALDTLEMLPGLVRIIYEIFLEPLYGSRRT